MMLGSGRYLCARIYAPVICNHCPNLRVRVALMCRAVTFWVSPQCRIKWYYAYLPRIIYYCKEQDYDCRQIPAMQGLKQGCDGWKDDVPAFPLGVGVGGEEAGSGYMSAGTWPRVSTASLIRRLTGPESASPVESNKCHFSLFFICSNPRSLAPLTDALRLASRLGCCRCNYTYADTCTEVCLNEVNMPASMRCRLNVTYFIARAGY